MGNELSCCGLPENIGSPKIRKVSKPTKDDFNKFKKLRSKIIKRVLFSDERFAKRTVESSIVNEVIRAVLNSFFFFFYKKISHAQKAQKNTKSTKITKSTKTQPGKAQKA